MKIETIQELHLQLDKYEFELKHPIIEIMRTKKFGWQRHEHADTLDKQAARFPTIADAKADRDSHLKEIGMGVVSISDEFAKQIEAWKFTLANPIKKGIKAGQFMGYGWRRESYSQLSGELIVAADTQEGAELDRAEFMRNKELGSDPMKPEIFNELVLWKFKKLYPLKRDITLKWGWGCSHEYTAGILCIFHNKNEAIAHRDHHIKSLSDNEMQSMIA